MPCLLVVDDDRPAVHLLRCAFQGTEVEVVTASNAILALDAFHCRRPDALVLSATLPDHAAMNLLEEFQAADPRVPVIWLTTAAKSDVAIAAMKQGAFACLVKPLDLMSTRELLARALELRRLANVPVRLAPLFDEAEPTQDLLLGNCAAMQEVRQAIERLAGQASRVLIRGESGTGKELVARALYQRGPRSGKRFLAVDCAAIAEPLLERELFGYESGAVAGAETPRIGKFEQAHGATLFLDEIGVLGPLLQGKLLRALEDRQLARLGGSQPLPSDALLIATTNRPLEQLVADGRFRSDLYYVLSRCTICLPPLRDHVADIPLLAEHCLHRLNRELGKTVTEISAAALELLIRYPWPGNVRELQSVLKQSLLHATGEVLLPHFLPPRLRERVGGSNDGPEDATRSVPSLEMFLDRELATGDGALYAKALACMERTLLARVLRHTGGNQSRAAKLLGITRGCLRNKIRQLRITIQPAVTVQSGPPPAEREGRSGA
jgi:DNA-binding NtrC family response regulator